MGANEYLKEYAEKYTIFVPSKEKELLPWLKKQVKRSRPERLLDLGCGPFELAQKYYDWGAREVIGLESNIFFSDRAKRAALESGARLIIGDASEIPVRSEFFDMVILNMLVHSATNLWQLHDFFMETNRVMRKTGLLIVTLLNENKAADLAAVQPERGQGTHPKPIVYPAEFPNGRLHLQASHIKPNTVESSMWLAGFRPISGWRERIERKVTPTYVLFSAKRRFSPGD